MRVFISYGDAADQVTALRLQALGAVNGLTVYVSPAYTRQGLATLLDPEAAQKLNDAEVVLGVVGAGLLEPSFGTNLVRIDPASADQAETGIVQHLRTVNAQQNAKTALLALATLALGLLILAPSD